MCVRAKEEVEACARAYGVTAAVVDVGESADLAEHFEVTKLPRVLVYHGQERIADIVGRSEGELSKVCKEHVFLGGVASVEDF